MLLSDGLLELEYAKFDTAHYRIRRVAWRHMERFPNRFHVQNQLERDPWSEHFNESKVERMIADQAARESAQN
jgi:hypothetical protein